MPLKQSTLAAGSVRFPYTDMDKQTALLEAFSKDTGKLQHLLLYGPPGSGKTTFARSLVEAIWGKQFLFSGALFLNASDERSLDSIRAKVYPFFNSRFSVFEDAKKPRFLVLDESETLTDQAQLAIRPILDYSPQSMCVIFLCNSLSRVHISLRSRFLRIRFEPLNQTILLKRLQDYSGTASIPSEFDRLVHRSDLRYFLQQPEKSRQDSQLLYNILQRKPLEKINIRQIYQILIFSAESFGLLTIPFIQTVLQRSSPNLLRLQNLQQQRETLEKTLDEFHLLLESEFQKK